jgi:hypothetical protein
MEMFITGRIREDEELPVTLDVISNNQYYYQNILDWCEVFSPKDKIAFLSILIMFYKINYLKNMKKVSYNENRKRTS